MAEPIRIYTPQRDLREELRRKVGSAPVDHANALLAAYELLQEAQDHGWLDTLRGAIGGGEAMIGKASELANTPEGIRLMRNLLAMARLIGELDPTLLDAVAKAISESRSREEKSTAPPSLWQTLQRLTNIDSRRALARVANFSQAFGRAYNAGAGEKKSSAGRSMYASVTAPVIAVALTTILASFWIGRQSLRK